MSIFGIAPNLETKVIFFLNPESHDMIENKRINRHRVFHLYFVIYKFKFERNSRKEKITVFEKSTII